MISTTPSAVSSVATTCLILACRAPSHLTDCRGLRPWVVGRRCWRMRRGLALEQNLQSPKALELSNKCTKVDIIAGCSTMLQLIASTPVWIVEDGWIRYVGSCSQAPWYRSLTLVGEISSPGQPALDLVKYRFLVQETPKYRPDKIQRKPTNPTIT